VVYITPIKAGSSFWDQISLVATAAAEDLGINLTIINGTGDRYNNLNILQKFTASVTGVDYIIVMPHRGKVIQTFATLEAAKIPFVTIERSADSHELAQISRPGKTFKYWLNEVYFDDIQGGRLLAQALITAKLAHNNSNPNTIPSIIGLNGNYSYVSKNRAQGLKQAVMPPTTLLQVVNTLWDDDTAKEQVNGLISRYPRTNIIWAASDGLALAAYDEIKAKNSQLIIGGIGWIPEAINAVAKGELQVTVGGHFMQVAWALVKIFDHHNGVHLHNDPEAINYALITEKNIDEHLLLLQPDIFQRVDFKKFSRFYQPELTRYDFDITKVVEQINHHKE